MTQPRRATVTEREGLIILHKQSGMTSHDVVRAVRRVFKMRRVGHAGTLDPMATGVLVVLLGKATKLFGKFEAFDKTYEATLRLGLKTRTADTQGEVLKEEPPPGVSEEQIRDVLKTFVGEIEQVPPMVSAVKHKGKRLYELARKGIEVERKPRQIYIARLELLWYRSPELKFRLECSKGTYVRQLAEDVAEALGTVGCISQIERTRVGPFRLEDAVTLEDLTDEAIRVWRDQ